MPAFNTLQAGLFTYGVLNLFRYHSFWFPEMNYESFRTSFRTEISGAQFIRMGKKYHPIPLEM